MKARRIVMFALVAAVSGTLLACSRGSGDASDAQAVAKYIATLSDRDDERDEQKYLAATMLGIIGAREAAPLLEERLARERSPKVRAAYARALGEIGRAGSTTALIAALEDENMPVKMAAIEALGRLDDPAAGAALRALASWDKGEIALAALRALGSLKSVDVSDPARFTDQGEPFETRIGRTWYVDATAGSDEADGSEASPLRTLTTAVTRLRAGAGDRVFATAGSRGVPFRESVRIDSDKSGTRGAPTVIAAWPDRPPPVLDGSREDDPDAASLEDGLLVQADYVFVSGFRARAYTDTGIEFDGVTGGAVMDCVAERCERHGVFLYYAPACTLVNVRAYRCRYQGISIRTSPRAVVLGGESMDNGHDGLLILYDSDDVVVHGFTARGNRQGIGFTMGSNAGRVIGAALGGNSVADLIVDPTSSAQAVATRFDVAP